MNEYEREIVAGIDVFERLLNEVRSPLRRAIVLNYLRHSYLEAAGRYEEIFAADMMVPNPVYRMALGSMAFALEGVEQVRAFYEGVIAQRIAIWGSNEQLAVADWGFAGELTFNAMLPGSVLEAEGDTVDDPNAIYVRRSRMAFVWPYTSEALLIGEHIYEDTSNRVLVKLEPGQEIPRARVVEVAAEALGRYEDEFQRTRSALAAR